MLGTKIGEHQFRNLEFIKAVEANLVGSLSEDSSLLGAEEPLAPGDIDKQIHDALNDPQSPFNQKVPGAAEALEQLYIQRSRNKKGGRR